MRETILVSDGEQRSALAVVRALGQAGYRVVVAAHERYPIAGASRYASQSVRVPDPLSQPGAFVNAAAEIALKVNAEVLLPITDAALRSLLPARGRFAGVIPFGSPSVVSRAADKRFVLAQAASLGIAVPRQVVLASLQDVAALDMDGWTWPVVAKPSRSVTDVAGGMAKLGVLWAACIEQLRTELYALPEVAYPVLLQERVVGPGTGVFLLRWDGATLASFSHERVREKPPSGGVSVCCRSVVPDDDLISQAESLLSALSWQGPAMVEFKRDAQTGTPYLMEVNGRFWGSLQLAIDAGVNFPVLLVRAALGEPVPPCPQWRVGVAMRWWWGEVDHLLARLRPSAMAGPRVSGGRLKAVGDFLFPGRATRNEVLRWTDPAPFIYESARWFASLGRNQ